MEVDKEVSPPILKREMEEEQKDGLLWVTGELGSPAIKNPPDTWSPEGAAGEKGAGQDPEAHPGNGARLEEGLSSGVGSSSGESADEVETTLRGPSVVRGSTRFHLGYGSSEEGESILVGTDMDESMGEEPVTVRCFIGKNQRSWYQYLPHLAGALRASVNRSTGYTPNMMMMGREIS